jgi:hypothetical protein
MLLFKTTVHSQYGAEMLRNRNQTHPTPSSPPPPPHTHQCYLITSGCDVFSVFRFARYVPLPKAITSISSVPNWLCYNGGKFRGQWWKKCGKMYEVCGWEYWVVFVQTLATDSSRTHYCMYAPIVMCKCVLLIAYKQTHKTNNQTHKKSKNIQQTNKETNKPRN